MYKIVPFKIEHLMPLLKEDLNKGVDHGILQHLEKTDAITIFVDGEAMVCGGVGELWKGRGHLWSIFSEKSKYHFVPTFRAIKSWLGDMNAKYDRIELSVSKDWLQGHRRAKLLGFDLETVQARKYSPSGETCSIYVMVRD